LNNHLDQGIALLHEGLNLQEAIGVEAYRPLYLTWQAEAYVRAGQVEQGLAASQQALDLVGKTGEGFMAAETHRIRGELLLCRDAAAAETCFYRAADIARRQSAKMWELRSTISLARLWQKQGKAKQARCRLAQIYGRFTEGFDTRDLQAARALLAELGG
jgi:predicted ATPase